MIRAPISLSAVAGQQPEPLRVFRDVRRNLDLIPETELKELEFDATFPLRLRTSVDKPKGVTCVRLYKNSDPDTPVYLSGLFWTLDNEHSDPDTAGLLVHLDGLVSGERYTATLRVDGSVS